MTFTEAAVEVLRLVGKPLHYKKITEIAIERNLLSHVGKTPEITMSSRLATMVKKDRGEAPIVKVKPGVFGLRDFGDEVLEAAEKESGHEYELPEEEPDETRRPAATPVPEPGGAEAAEGAEPTAPPRSEKKLPGQDVFAEEEDDDVPILAKLDEEEEGDEEAKGRRKRRRRRNKRKGGREEGEAEAEGREDRDRDRGREDRDRDRGREDRDRDRGREDRDRDRGRERDRGRDRGRERDRGRGDRERDRGRDRGRERRPSRRERVSGDWDREPAESEVLGHDLADAVRDVLANGSPRALAYGRVAELLVKKGKLSGDAGALVPTVAAAVRGDVARRAVAGTIPRFREIDGEVELVEWSLPREAMRASEEATRAADRQRDLARRAFLRRVGELPMAGLAELLATWLNAEGVVQLRAVRRAGGSSHAFHLTGVLKRGFEETRLAIVVYRDGSDLGREQVIDVRGALHHYDNASAAWLVTTGQVLSGARDEAGAPGMAPCGLFDGVELARAMERVNVGLRRHAVPLVSLDLDLLDALGRGQATPAREVTRERARQEELAREVPRGEEAAEEPEELADETLEDEAEEDEGKGRRRRRRRRRRPREERAEGEVATEGEAAAEEGAEPAQTADESEEESEREAVAGEDDEARDEAEVEDDIDADASPDEYDDDSDEEDESDDEEDESDDEEDDEDEDDADEEYDGDLQASYEDEPAEDDEEERLSAQDDEEE